MMHQTLGISDYHVTHVPVSYTCYGLGSCVGVFISDRTNKINGGAHIPLPDEQPGGDGAGQILSSLLKLFQASGSDLQTLRAKIAGGASFGTRIGEQTSLEILRLLCENKIFIAAKDLGGSFSRTARFNSETGELAISTSEFKNYSI